MQSDRFTNLLNISYSIWKIGRGKCLGKGGPSKKSSDQTDHIAGSLAVAPPLSSERILIGPVIL